jgi:hypothetical protein
VAQAWRQAGEAAPQCPDPSGVIPENSPERPDPCGHPRSLKVVGGHSRTLAHRRRLPSEEVFGMRLDVRPKEEGGILRWALEKRIERIVQAREERDLVLRRLPEDFLALV